MKSEEMSILKIQGILISMDNKDRFYIDLSEATDINTKGDVLDFFCNNSEIHDEETFDVGGGDVIMRDHISSVRCVFDKKEASYFLKQKKANSDKNREVYGGNPEYVYLR